MGFDNKKYGIIRKVVMEISTGIKFFVAQDYTKQIWLIYILLEIEIWSNIHLS